MPIDTQFGKLNIGRDVSMDIILASGQHLIISNVTEFDAKPRVKKLDSKGIDGITRNGVVPEGYTIKITFDRSSRVVDDWWAALEAAYFRGDVLTNVTILETIKEGDGSISQWRFEGVALHVDDLGNFKSDAYVKNTLNGEASKRTRVQ